MENQKHWDIDDDYIVDVTNSFTIFQRIQATDDELILASSAPELLEALQKSLPIWEGHFLDVGEYSILQQCRSAIAKALGKE